MMDGTNPHVSSAFNSEHDAVAFVSELPLHLIDWLLNHNLFLRRLVRGNVAAGEPPTTEDPWLLKYAVSYDRIDILELLVHKELRFCMNEELLRHLAGASSLDVLQYIIETGLFRGGAWTNKVRPQTGPKQFTFGNPGNTPVAASSILGLLLLTSKPADAPRLVGCW